MSKIAAVVEKNSDVLREAVAANQQRGFYAHWPEAPSGKIYGETANADGQAAFQARINSVFEDISADGAEDSFGEEESPFGFPLEISYPVFSEDTLITRANGAWKEWRSLSVEERASILIETLERAAAHFFEIAYATMHTTGQGFVMAFQASGPHAFDRGLEAIAQGYSQISAFSPKVDWTKRVGREEYVTVHKTFNIVPRGINLVVGCSTFPTWNSTPGIFAGLVTGNPVLVKPHPGAVLPIAILVASMRGTLRDLGLNPDIVQLASDSSRDPLALRLATNPNVKIIDYTGGTEFGSLLEKVAAENGKAIFSEKSGVNSAILDSVDNLDRVLDNLAFGAVLYSGQMCTAPQNFFINRNGVREGDAVVPYEEVVERLAAKIKQLATHPKIGAGTLGALQSVATLERLTQLSEHPHDARIRLESEIVEQPGFPAARSRTPLLLEVAADKADVYGKELFGPIYFVIPTDSFEHSLELVTASIKEHGALTSAVYSCDASQRALAEEKVVFEAAAPIAFNYVGNIWVNQSASFSDFHGAGANAAGTATFTDAAFVSNRYNVIGTREIR